MGRCRIGRLLPALACAIGLGASSAASAEEDRAWYLPDGVKLQLAGNIGFVSPGLGYDWLDRHLEADLFLGWVPEALGGDLFSVTGKFGVRPWRLRIDRVELWPAKASLQLTHHFGERYFVVRPDHYPPGYYPPSALILGVGLGSAASWKPPGWRSRVGLYYEFVAIDAMVWAWLENLESIRPAEVFSLALGVFLEL